MIKTCIIATAVIGLALAAPLSAHHYSQDPDLVEEHMDPDALVRHNDAVEDVLERMEDMGISTMEGGSENAGLAQDPSDAQNGATCSAMVDGVCDGESGDYGTTDNRPQAWGQGRSPHLYVPPTP